MQKKCFFTGHRDTPQEILPLLIEAVERHISEYGVTDFYVGHYGNFDRMAGQVVKLAKEKYPHIRLTLLLPYHPSEQPISTPEGFDGTYYPNDMETTPRRFAIVKANQFMVKECTHLIAYVKHSFGGSGQLLEYAQKRVAKGQLWIENLGEELLIPTHSR